MIDYQPDINYHEEFLKALGSNEPKEKSMTEHGVIDHELAAVEVNQAPEAKEIWTEESIEGFVQDDGFSDDPKGN